MHHKHTHLDELVAVLTEDPAQTPDEVFRRCGALEQLSASGTANIDALPAILRSLVVRVSVDCALALRVAAAEAVWKVGQRHDLALPFLAWALKDEHWGVSRKATEVLAEMGTRAHEAIPELANLAERRMQHGPFFFEKLGSAKSGEPLLALIAKALGNCGQGIVHIAAARQILARMLDCTNTDVSAAATDAIEKLRDVPK